MATIAFRTKPKENPFFTGKTFPNHEIGVIVDCTRHTVYIGHLVIKKSNYFYTLANLFNVLDFAEDSEIGNCCKFRLLNDNEEIVITK